MVGWNWLINRSTVGLYYYITQHVITGFVTAHPYAYSNPHSKCVTSCGNQHASINKKQLTLSLFKYTDCDNSQVRAINMMAILEFEIKIRIYNIKRTAFQSDF